MPSAGFVVDCKKVPGVRPGTQQVGQSTNALYQNGIRVTFTLLADNVSSEKQETSSTFPFQALVCKAFFELHVRFVLLLFLFLLLPLEQSRHAERHVKP